MWTSLTDMLSGTPMGVTAENLAAKFDVTRLKLVVVRRRATKVVPLEAIRVDS